MTPTSRLDLPFDPVLVGFQKVNVANNDDPEGWEYTLKFPGHLLEYVMMPAEIKGVGFYYVLLCYYQSRDYQILDHWMPELATVREFFDYLTGENSPVNGSVYKRMLDSQYRKWLLDEILNELD